MNNYVYEMPMPDEVYKVWEAKQIARHNFISERCDNRVKHLELLDKSGQFSDRVKLKLLNRFEDEETGEIFEQWNYSFFYDGNEAVIDARTGKFYHFIGNDHWELDERKLEDGYGEQLEEELLLCLREISCEHCGEIECENFACLNDEEAFAHYCNDTRGD